jgi:hypothetical protein
MVSCNKCGGSGWNWRTLCDCPQGDKFARSLMRPVSTANKPVSGSKLLCWVNRHLWNWHHCERCGAVNR